MKINPKRGNGFTLVELAVVLVLIGIVMTMGLKMVVATLDNAAYSETKSKQERIRIALISYLRTNGKLPCPDNTAGIASGTAPQTCSTNVSDGYGVVPWQTLGISREAAIDGWGNYFTYAVANGVNPIAKNWTSKTNAGDFSVNELKAPSVAFGIQELDATFCGLASVPF
jgi:prepilin-type N-terminal cleavage/methylation domain-containing protein